MAQNQEQAWAQHPMTQKYLQGLKSLVEQSKELWASRKFEGKSLEQSALQNAEALGAVSILQELIGQIEDLAKEGE